LVFWDFKYAAFIPNILSGAAARYICAMLKKRRWIEIPLHLLFWAGVFYVLTSLNSSHIHIWAKTAHRVSDKYDAVSISPYVYLICAFLAVLFYGNIFWVFPKAVRYPKMIVRLAVCTGWFIVVFSANYLAAGPLFEQANRADEPPRREMGMPEKHDRLKLDMMIRRDTPRGPDPNQVGTINFMISDWRHLQPILLFAFLVILGISFAYFFLKQWAKSELIQLSTENKFLRSQVNPHFLFNTLNNLFSMAQAKGNDELADGISKLSGMMRYMLYDSNAESVLLGTEINYLEECITLNKLRYAEEEVTVRFDYPSQTNGIYIAPMLFIPFVENAFKHGVAIGETTALTINIQLSGQTLSFTCENANHNAIRKMAIEKSGIGLENVKRRLELLYPGKHQLQLTETDEKFSVNLQLNLA
jgi:two-component system LytT family sensor kinase